MPVSSTYHPAPRILALGDGFYDEVQPARFPQHELRFRNGPWSARVGLDALDTDEWTAHFARFEPLPDNLQAPLAMRYHGHQFGVYNPHLGDGRGFLFAQVVEPTGERLLDLSTKGSGRTPYCRGADGRLTLKGGVREALATEMLEALGVPTSKTLSLVETGERLQRHDEPSPTRACVLVRLGHSHIRFGTFQRLAYHGDGERIRALFEWCVANYVPHCAEANDVPEAFLREVMRRSAELCASWTAAGFVHGVLNTDNMLITGESFDYGPWRFLPHYDPKFTAAYFDQTGMYAFGRQSDVVRWNLSRLGESLRVAWPQLDVDTASMGFEATYRDGLRRRVLRRLGIESVDPDTDDMLVDATFALMHQTHASFAQFFFDWYGGLASRDRARESPQAARYAGPAFHAFLDTLQNHPPRHPQLLELPYFARARPCDMHVDEVESIWEAIDRHDDWGPFEAKIDDIRHTGHLLQLGDP